MSQQTFAQMVHSRNLNLADKIANSNNLYTVDQPRYCGLNTKYYWKMIIAQCADVSDDLLLKILQQVIPEATFEHLLKLDDKDCQMLWKYAQEYGLSTQELGDKVTGDYDPAHLFWMRAKHQVIAKDAIFNVNEVNKKFLNAIHKMDIILPKKCKPLLANLMQDVSKFESLQDSPHNQQQNSSRKLVFQEVGLKNYNMLSSLPASYVGKCVANATRIVVKMRLKLPNLVNRNVETIKTNHKTGETSGNGLELVVEHMTDRKEDSVSSSLRKLAV